jgi:hypothetical protein
MQDRREARNLVRVAKVIAILLIWLLVLTVLVFDSWILLVVIVPAAVIGFPLVWSLGSGRRRPGEISLAFVCYTANRTEADMKATVLRVAGIPSRIVNKRDYDMDGGGWLPGAYEIWVAASDEVRAKEVLGFE